MAKIELICNDECAKRVQKTIIETARTGHKGDGIVAISPIEEAISIRTGKKQLKDNFL
jgi:nitrogen regulatory protein PII